MKKILGVLLALCFFVSVTAAAVSADKVTVPPKNDDHKNFPKNDDKFKKDDKKHKKFVKGHWEIKLVKTIVKQKVLVNHHWKIITKVVYKPVKVWVPGKWIYY